MRAFNLRPASLLLALLLAGALAAGARQAPRPATNDFLLRVPASSLDGLVRSYNLQVIRVVAASPDPLGRSVYLVRAPQGVSPDTLIQEVQASAPDVVGIEPAVLASLPETYQGLNLAQHTRAILGEVAQASRLVPPGGAIDSYWIGPVTDRQIRAGATAQLAFTFKNPPSATPAGYTLSLGFAEAAPATAVRQVFQAGGHGDINFQLTNTTGQLLTLSSIALHWPDANGRVMSVRLAGRDLIDTAIEVPFGTNPDGTPRQVWRAYVQQTAATVLRVDEAAKTSRGAGAVIAVIDSGVDTGHPLLQGVLLPGYDFIHDQADPSEWKDVLDQHTRAILGQHTRAILGGNDILPLNASTVAVLDSSQISQLDPATVPPAFGHGTMVSGVIHRVAPEAKILPLKAFDGSGSGQVSDVIRAIYYAVDQGVTAINMSFSVEEFSPELMRAVNYAADHGIVCVSSAGNDGRQVMVYPAALGNAVGVASTTADDHLSVFSNYGGDLVTIAAPGEDVVTTYPGGGWALVSGTSFSAPWISGLAAVFAGKNNRHKTPDATDFYLASEALSHAVPVVGVPDGAAGFGRADFAQAVKRLKGGLVYDGPARADYTLGLTFSGGCATAYPPPPADACAARPATQLRFADKKVTWQITNTGSVPLPLNRLNLSWPVDNGGLKTIQWNSTRIFNQRAPGPGLQLLFGAGSGPASPQLDPGQTVILTLEFESTALTS
jgi:subtilisin family serine protease